MRSCRVARSALCSDRRFHDNDVATLGNSSSCCGRVVRCTVRDARSCVQPSYSVARSHHRQRRNRTNASLRSRRSSPKPEPKAKKPNPKDKKKGAKDAKPEPKADTKPEANDKDNDAVLGFVTNWELSAARALTVVHYLQDDAKLDPTRLATVAFSQYRPVSKNRAKNRRIEIVPYPRAAITPK